MLAGTFPDLIEIDAASHNSVDDIRDLVEKVRYAPQRGRSKVYVIDEVHMVSKAGFNALLKTLEEPPPHVVFILATTDPQQLLDTVVSRCQRFDFKMIPVRTVYERLRFVAEQEGVSVPDSSLITSPVASGCSGAWLTALLTNPAWMYWLRLEGRVYWRTQQCCWSDPPCARSRCCCPWFWFCKSGTPHVIVRFLLLL